MSVDNSRPTEDHPPGDLATHSNELKVGITEEQLIAAVEISGFPLQLQVGTLLRELLHSDNSSVPGSVQDEWTYVDRDTAELRTLDLYGSLWLADPTQERYPQPMLDMLIECKRSDYPFVFFPAANTWLPKFPAMVGARHDSIDVALGGTGPSISMTLPQCLNLATTALANAPAHAITASAARRDSKLQLVGTAYNDTVLPLVKGLDHLRKISVPTNPSYFECIATLLVCVLDAPMVMARPEGDGTKLAYPPWVRLIRSEPGRTDGDRSWSQYVIDYVHASFVRDYMTQYVLPFGKVFQERVDRHWREISAGVGIADEWGNPGMESTLRPRPVDEGSSS